MFKDNCLLQVGCKARARELMHLVLLVPGRVATGQPWAVSQSGMVTNWEEKTTWETLFRMEKWSEEEGFFPSYLGAAQEFWARILHFSQPWSPEAVPASARGRPHLRVHVGTGIIDRGIFFPRRICRTAQRQGNSPAVSRGCSGAITSSGPLKSRVWAQLHPLRAQGLPGFCFTGRRLGGTWAGGRGIPVLTFCNRTASERGGQKMGAWTRLVCDRLQPAPDLWV